MKEKEAGAWITSVDTKAKTVTISTEQSSSLFNIETANYQLWKGESIPLNLEAIERAMQELLSNPQHPYQPRPPIILSPQDYKLCLTDEEFFKVVTGVTWEEARRFHAMKSSGKDGSEASSTTNSTQDSESSEPSTETVHSSSSSESVPDSSESPTNQSSITSK